jgi:hypothetical protein
VSRGGKCRASGVARWNDLVLLFKVRPQDLPRSRSPLLCEKRSIKQTSRPDEHVERSTFLFNPCSPKKTRVREQSSHTCVLLGASPIPSLPGEGGVVCGNPRSLMVCWGLSGAFHPRRLCDPEPAATRNFGARQPPATCRGKHHKNWAGRESRSIIGELMLAVVPVRRDLKSFPRFAVRGLYHPSRRITIETTVPVPHLGRYSAQG